MSQNILEKNRLLLAKVIYNENIFEGQNILRLSKKQIHTQCNDQEVLLNYLKEGTDC